MSPVPKSPSLSFKQSFSPCTPHPPPLLPPSCPPAHLSLSCLLLPLTPHAPPLLPTPLSSPSSSEVSRLTNCVSPIPKFPFDCFDQAFKVVMYSEEYFFGQVIFRKVAFFTKREGQLRKYTPSCETEMLFENDVYFASAEDISFGKFQFRLEQLYKHCHFGALLWDRVLTSTYFRLGLAQRAGTRFPFFCFKTRSENDCSGGGLSRPDPHP